MALVLDCLFLGCLLFVASGVGLLVLGLLSLPGQRAMDTAAIVPPLGLGLVSLATLIPAELGYLNVPGLCIAGFSLGLLACLGWYRRFWKQQGDLSQWSSLNLSLWPMVLLLVISLASLVCTRVPVTDGDALCYHLQVPKTFLANQGLSYEPDLHETVYPLLMENLFGIALAFRTTEACRLISWVMGLSLAVSVAAAASRWLGSRAIWASVLVLSVPAISNGMTVALNDVALSAWCQAALLSCLMWWERPMRSTAFLAGLMAGLALGVKYPAIVWVALLGLTTLGIMCNAYLNQTIQCEKSIAKININQFTIYIFTLLFVGGVWYLRAYMATGNPVYPFFKQVFGGSGLDVVLEPAKRPLQVTSCNLLTALVPMTLFPDRFDSMAHQFGPIFLMLLPPLLLLKAPNRLRLLVFMGFGFYLSCLTQRQSMRFLLPALGPWALGSAWVLCRMGISPRPTARLAMLLIISVLAGESALAFARIRHGGPVLLGQEDRETFLVKREPTFSVGKWIEANLPPDARIIGQDHRGFYIPRPYSMELAHRRRTGLGHNRESPEEIVRILRSRGFTHLLLCPPIPNNAVEFDSWLSEALASWVNSRRPVYQANLADGEGVHRFYALYNLAHLPEANSEGVLRP